MKKVCPGVKVIRGLLPLMGTSLCLSIPRCETTTTKGFRFVQSWDDGCTSPSCVSPSRDAENLLELEPLGSFLIRVSHSHVGYTLSYK